MSQTVDQSLERDFLVKEISEVVPGGDQWRLMPNDQLGGRMPEELINGTVEERERVRNLVEAIKHGMMS